MDASPTTNSPYSFTTFGDLLKFLRRRARLTQLELSINVGYSESQISRLEQNQRLPDLTAAKALFIPALHLETEHELATRFLELAQSARQEDAPSPGVPPYKGLLYFDESDFDLFFGREALTARLVGHVIDLVADASTRLLAVVGASGSGKSSLVRAGLVVALKRAGWGTRVFTPTANPLRILEEHLTTKSMEGEERILILVDQLEELFTLCHDEIERITFIEKLLSAAKDVSKRISVVVALRADFYSHCAQYPLLRQAVAAEQKYIGQMIFEELRSTIEEPARRGGWEFEHGLVDLLLQDIGARGSQEPEPGALPLLSHALLATWERRRGHILTIDGYRASGGVRSAIAETAESVFTDQLDRTQQDIAQNVFLRLTELGVGTEDTRRRATLNELVMQSAEATQLRTVLNTLAEARLITLNEDNAEVAHEALIREWQRLHEWLTQDREGLLLHRHLTDAAHEWELSGRDPSELFRGARLARVREWFAENEEKLNALERAFLAASIEDEERDVLEREAQRQRELETAQELARTQSRAAAQLKQRAMFLMGAFMLAIVLASVAAFSGMQAKLQSQDAQSRELAAAAISKLDDDPELSILLSLEALSKSPTLESENALHRSILASRVMFTLHHDAEVWSVIYSPDGRQIATASQDKMAKIWDANTGKLLFTLTGHTESVNGLAYSPDGKYLATSSDDHTAKIWDARTGEELLTLSGHSNWVYRIAFSPDETRIVTASHDKTAKIWDAKTGKELLTFSNHGNVVFDVAFSPDGSKVASCGLDDTVRIWDIDSGKELLVISIAEGSIIRSVVFSPDGGRIIAINPLEDAEIWVWDAVTGDKLSSFLGAPGLVADIVFNQNGNLIAVANWNQKAYVQDSMTGRTLYTLSGHSSAVNGVAFNPGGTQLATSSWDHTVRVWDLTPGKESIFIPIASPWSHLISYSPDGKQIIADYPEEHSAKIWDTSSGEEILSLNIPGVDIDYASFNPDGKRIAGVSAGNIFIWDAISGQVLLTLSDYAERVFPIAFNPDGSNLASISAFSELTVWDLSSGKALFTLQGQSGFSTPLGDNLGYVIRGLAYSPDGKNLFLGDSEGVGIIRDASTGEYLSTLYPEQGNDDQTYIPETIISADFSPDGRRLILAGDHGNPKIMDVVSGSELLTLKGHTGPVPSAMFSPDGKLAATSSFDNTTKVWDTATGENLLTLPIAGLLAFSPDGKYLAVGGDDGIYIFVVSKDDLVSLARSRLTRSLTPEECQQYLHVEQCPFEP